MRLSDSRSLWCITSALIFVVGLHGYLIVDGLIRGVAISYSRVGPSITYTLVGQPKLFWFTIIWNVVCEAVFITLTLGMAWAAREMSKNERPKKR